ncbi:hypothetical protein ACP70R_042559 [Stipagrostis hirtigluma subsp. patula]
MALGAEAVRRRPFIVPAAAGEGEVSGPAPVFLAAGEDRPVDPMIWGDEKRMKRELMAWAKAVASMAATSNTSSPATAAASSVASPSTRRRAVS